MLKGLKANRLPIIGISVVYIAFGLALLLQPTRWSRTPAYGILLDIFNQKVWGIVYLVIAFIILVALASQSRVLIVVAHTLSLGLSAGWLAAFIVRYLTDHSTTIVNVVSWSTFTAIILYSVVQIDKKPIFIEVPVMGLTGPPGLTGEQGLKGNQGNRGPEGARGLTGDPGRDN